MKSQIKAIDARLAEIETELKALDTVAEADLDQDVIDAGVKLTDEIKELEAKRAKFQKIVDAQAKFTGDKTEKPAAIEPSTKPEASEEKKDVLPIRVKGQKSKFFNSVEDAYVSGQYLAHLMGNKQAGEILAAQNITTDADGGFLVPDPLSNALINLMEEYGVARRVCRRIVMSALTWTVPKVTEHAQISYPAEAAAISDSDMAFSQITLTAKKMAGLVKLSTEIQEDSIVPIMDTVVQSLAYQAAIAEDNNLFNGVASAINADGIKVDSNVADTNVANVGAITLANLTAAMVNLGNPIIGARNEWYMNPTLFWGPIRDLLNAAGGNTMADFQAGQRPTLLGAPVNFVNVLPGASASTAGDLLAVFGDMSMGCYFGDRRSINFRTLNELYANTDQVGVQFTQRLDIVVANPEVLSKVTITG